jgi:hypothetical protein
MAPVFWSRETLIDYDGDEQFVEEWVQGAWVGYQVGLHILQQQPIAAYQDDYGNAVSAGDFDGGEDEMHETAHQKAGRRLFAPLESK